MILSPGNDSVTQPRADDELILVSLAKEYTLKLVITVAFIIGLVLAFIFLKDSEPVWFGVSVTVIVVGSIGAMIMVTTE